MKVSDFSYELPEHLIAKEPTASRSGSRLLHLDLGGNEINHYKFSDLPKLIEPSDLMVFNNTRVIAARIFGKKETGGRVEIMLDQIMNSHQATAIIGSSKSIRAGTRIFLKNGLSLCVEAKHGDLYQLTFPSPGVIPIAADVGEVPLPPYIGHQPTVRDSARYQTVYAKFDGAVAAPTAGLHFDQPLFRQLDKKGVLRKEITLHVGAGTFLPVRDEKIENHNMHQEYLKVSEDVCDAIRLCQNSGGRVIAVGTTTVRSLEAASISGGIRPLEGSTRIFIYPGHVFQSVDAIITNFHLPRSTLMMLVSAFAGLEHIKKAYRIAIEESYRFFSYGDAMLISR
ncbi:MAG: tRNA preQ1(34) S-adenosylmethionine ribosyltransferase-isomerase QueA [Gammaproteobacteria bacterium]|nr:tRNA preQ1(34) S-adenosylmethionine ribosyltransferase-isomerase QueA [Gammaproteobacteria bacterium]|tara:strand:- start:248 stop:1267 length:1020 start_codon:yes stop_codon:yes gene_type:complete